MARGELVDGEVRIAVVQLEAVPFAPEENARRGSDAIADAAQGGARVVVLPELTNSGYVLDREGMFDVGESLLGAPEGPCVEAWATAAREHQVSVVAGIAERVGEACYNSAVILDPSGEIRDVYRKLHLFDGEQDVFQPGDRGLPVVTIDGLRLAALICYDLRFPEALRILALRGADLVAVPTAWVRGFDRAPSPAPGMIPQALNAVVQANLNQVWVAAAGRCGTDRGTRLLGNSLIVDPYGRIVSGPMQPEASGLGFADVSVVAAVTARQRGSAIRPRDDRRTDVYDEYLGYEGR